jgi:putative transposase
LRSFKCSVADGTESEDTEEELIRTQKVRLLPNKAQKKLLDAWRHGARYSYNKAVFLMNETSQFNKHYLRDLITPQEVCGHEPWLLDTPKDIRAGSVFEAAKNAKSAFSNLRNGNIQRFELKFKSRKQEDAKGWTIEVPKTAIKRRSDRRLQIYGTYCAWDFETLGRMGPIEKDCKVQYDGAKYYLLIPYTQRKSYSDGSLASELRESVAALDPGVRTFQTVYTPNAIYDLGNGSATRLHALAIQLDRLLAHKSRIPKRHRRSERAFAARILKTRRKMQNLRDELHYKTCEFLTRTAKVILIPEFQTREMSRRFRRRIGTKTVRGLSLLSHYKFRQRLKAKASERGVRVLVVTEHYTSKTCGQCGTIREDLGSAKVFKCRECGLLIDRDHNGARNILLRALREIAPIELGALQDGAMADMPCLA